jgi:ABC-type dipeptide/oligopeptide/nickel transport system ATPase component
MSIILITHNLGIIRSVADRVAVMFRGQIVETGPVDEILKESPARLHQGAFALRPSHGPEAAALEGHRLHHARVAWNWCLPARTVSS